MKIFKTFRDDLYGIYGVVQSAYGYKVFNILKNIGNFPSIHHFLPSKSIH